MPEISQFVGWAFTGKAGNVFGFLLQWWIRITALWIVLLIVVVACAVVSAVAHPEGGNFLMAYLTVEGAAALAMMGPAVLALVLFVAYCVIGVFVFAAALFAALLGA